MCLQVRLITSPLNKEYIGGKFPYEKVGELDRANEPSNEIDRVSNLDNSLSFGAKQKSLGQIFFLL